ncbi:hypothetical protein DQ04_08081020 [Trypanosoma grayi]|uniref:hypothetical protein n=1 Tax=Trypanosoma grayi TaxID=71804 RepID=UPI0004F46473|nr:hypothetical protein DQ04_08081020 [Trypanosoma grayi]KEG08069.1 hypothetical protein DQ04_08081020 [Trypanosoma grayi]
MALPLILRPGSRERPATRNGSEIGLSARRHNGASNVDSDDDSTSVYVSTTSASSVHFLVVSHNSGFCGSSHGVSKTPRLRHCLSVTISPISSAFTTPRLFFGGGGAAAGRARRAHSYNSDVDWISLNRQDTGEASPAAARVYKNAASGTKASPSHMKDWIPFSRTNSRSSATRGAFSSAVYASVLADVAAPTPKKQSRKGKHTAASPHTTHCSKLTPSDIGSSSTSVSTAGASSRRLSIEGNINKPHAYKEHDEVRSNGSGNCVNWSYPSEKQTAAVPVPAIKRFTDAIRYLQSQP